MQSTRARNQEKTRASLRAAAAQSFAHGGVQNTSIEQIALRAGFTRGAFYSNYRSKLELLIDVLAVRQIEEIATWRHAVENHDDIDNVLDRLADQFAVQIRNKSHGPLLAAELELEAARNPVFRPHYVAYLDQLFDAIGKFVQSLLHHCGKTNPPSVDHDVVAIRALCLTWISEVVGEARAGRAINGREALKALLQGIIAAAPRSTDANILPIDKDEDSQ